VRCIIENLYCVSNAFLYVLSILGVSD
jgi:hypothetical protein